MNLLLAKQELEEKGHAKIDSVYTNTEIEKIICIIDKIDHDTHNSINTKAIFSIRKLLLVAPALKKVLCNENLVHIIHSIGSKDYFITKAIYFDKPAQSNWFVPFHQDISISIKDKIVVEGYKNWTFKKGQFGVQTPSEILDNIFTIRIHLDHTTKENGALKVLSATHKKGIIRNDNTLLNKSDFISCPVNTGGVMLMKPLLFHASNRTTNNKQRRVIHLEFSNMQLEKPLEWLEKINI